MSRWPKTFLLIAIVASFLLSRLAVMKLGGGMPLLNPYLYNIAIIIGINIILATSLNLVNGYTGQFSLGHAGFMAIGAYASAAITNKLGQQILTALGGAGMFSNVALFLLALCAGGLAAALTGLIVGAPSLRLKGDYLAIVTLGFGEIIRVIIQNTEAVGGPRGWSVYFGYTDLFWTFALAAVTIYVVTSLVDSTYGRGFLATRDDEVAAEAMGVNTTKFKVIAFVIAAFFAGVAGGLYAHYIQFISPGAGGFDFMLSVSIVVMVILGGMGSTAGVTLAAVLLTLLPEVLRWFAKSDLLDRIIRALFSWWLSAENFAAVSAKTKELFENRMIFYSLL